MKSLETRSGVGPHEAPSPSSPPTRAASATLVNRTHRVVREQAKLKSDRRQKFRSLFIPLAVSSALVIILATGVWTALAQNELSPTGIPDASDQMLVFLLWFFPVSAAALAMVWFQRSRPSSGSGYPR